jgi:hypothetical protein
MIFQKNKAKILRLGFVDFFFFFYIKGTNSTSLEKGSEQTHLP